MRRFVIEKLSFPETAYDSIDDAIAAPEAAGRRALSEATTQTIRGSLIQDFRWNDRRVEIDLASGQTLTIFLRDGSTCWSLEQGELSLATTVQDRELAEVVFSQDLKERWDRARLASDRIGRPIQKIFAGEALLFVYVEGVPILLFSWLQRKDPEGELLHWSETE